MTPSQQKLALVDLQKQQQQVKAREDAVASKEAYLETAVAQAQSQLNVVEAKIDVSQQQLSELERQIEASQLKITVLDKEEQQLKQKQQKSHNVARDKLTKLDQRIADAENILVIEKERLDNVTAEIADRQKYQDTQEELIQQSFVDGNEQLLAMRNQVEQVELEKEAYLKDILRLKQDKKTAEEQLTETTNRLGALDERYNETAAKYRESLARLQDDVGRVSMELKTINKEADDKLLILKAKETEILAQRDVLAKEKEDIAQLRRRANSAQSLYGD